MIGPSPCWPPSPALNVMPGMYCRACSTVLTLCSWMIACGMTLTVCGMLRNGTGSRAMPGLLI
jgi:hypothetical protein